MKPESGSNPKGCIIKKNKIKNTHYFYDMPVLLKFVEQKD